jgi:hypothetical protein
MERKLIFDEERKCSKTRHSVKIYVSFRKAYQYRYYKLIVTVLDPEVNFLIEGTAEHFVPAIKLITVCPVKVRCL